MLLANYFLSRFNQEFGRRIRGFTEQACAAMTAHDWPGNVRELENRLKRAVVMADRRMIDAADLELAPREQGGCPTSICAPRGCGRSTMSSRRRWPAATTPCRSRPGCWASAGRRSTACWRRTDWPAKRPGRPTTCRRRSAARNGNCTERTRMKQMRYGTLGWIMLGAWIGAWPLAAHADYLSNARTRLKKGDLKAAQIELRNAVRADPAEWRGALLARAGHVRAWRSRGVAARGDRGAGARLRPAPGRSAAGTGAAGAEQIRRTAGYAEARRARTRHLMPRSWSPAAMPRSASSALRMRRNPSPRPSRSRRTRSSRCWPMRGWPSPAPIWPGRRRRSTGRSRRSPNRPKRCWRRRSCCGSRTTFRAPSPCWMS